MPHKYSKRVSNIVGKTMDEYKHDDLKSGRAKAPVRNRKQAIAIGLNKARQSGEQVPQRKKK